MIRFPLALKGVPTDFPLEYRVLIPLFKKDGSYPYQRRGYYELEYIRDLDQTVVVIDLIYGLPYQTMEIWEDDIKTFLELELDGIDLYQLIIFKDKPLGKVIEEKRMIAADVAMQADMFARGVELMKKARYRRLSKSHWARTTRERNIYNTMLYLPGSVCIPFGCGAGGWLKGYFFFQDKDLKSSTKKLTKDINYCYVS